MHWIIHSEPVRIDNIVWQRLYTAYQEWRNPASNTIQIRRAEEQGPVQTPVLKEAELDYLHLAKLRRLNENQSLKEQLKISFRELQAELSKELKAKPEISKPEFEFKYTEGKKLAIEHNAGKDDFTLNILIPAKYISDNTIKIDKAFIMKLDKLLKAFIKNNRAKILSQNSQFLTYQRDCKIHTLDAETAEQIKGLFKKYYGFLLNYHRQMIEPSSEYIDKEAKPDFDKFLASLKAKSRNELEYQESILEANNYLRRIKILKPNLAQDTDYQKVLNFIEENFRDDLRFFEIYLKRSPENHEEISSKQSSNPYPHQVFPYYKDRSLYLVLNDKAINIILNQDSKKLPALKAKLQALFAYVKKPIEDNLDKKNNLYFIHNNEIRELKLSCKAFLDQALAEGREASTFLFEYLKDLKYFNRIGDGLREKEEFKYKIETINDEDELRLDAFMAKRDYLVHIFNGDEILKFFEEGLLGFNTSFINQGLQSGLLDNCKLKLGDYCTNSYEGSHNLNSAINYLEAELDGKTIEELAL